MSPGGRLGVVLGLLAGVVGAVHWLPPVRDCEPARPPGAPARGWSPALDRYDVGASEGPAPSPPLATPSPRVGADTPSVTLFEPTAIESAGVSPPRPGLPSVPGG